MTQVSIEDVMLSLIFKNGSTTSLEVKEELRRLYPDLKIYQTDVRSDCQIIAKEYGLNVSDNGTFLTYSMNVEYCTITALNRVFDSNPTCCIMFQRQDGTMASYDWVTHNSEFDEIGYKKFTTANNEQKRFLPLKLVAVSTKKGKIYIRNGVTIK